MNALFKKATLATSALASTLLLATPASAQSYPAMDWDNTSICLRDSKGTAVTITAAFLSSKRVDLKTEEGRNALPAINAATEKAISIYKTGLADTVRPAIYPILRKQQQNGQLGKNPTDENSELNRAFKTAIDTVSARIKNDPEIAAQDIEIVALPPVLDNNPNTMKRCRDTFAPE